MPELKKVLSKMKKEDVPPMDKLMAVGKYVSWVNEVLNMSFDSVEQMGNGGAYCALLEMAYPGTINMKQVKNRENIPEVDRIENLKKFQTALNQKVGILKEVKIMEMSKKSVKENLTFMQWFYWRFGPKIRVVKALQLSKQLKKTKDEEAREAIKALSVKVHQVVADSNKAAKTSEDSERATSSGWKKYHLQVNKTTKIVDETKNKVEEAARASKIVQNQVEVVVNSNDWRQVGNAAIEAYNQASVAKIAAEKAHHLAKDAQNTMDECAKTATVEENKIRNARLKSHHDVIEAFKRSEACREAAKVMEKRTKDVVSAAKAWVTAAISANRFLLYEKAVKAAGEKYYIDEDVQKYYDAAEEAIENTNQFLLNIEGVEATPGGLWRYTGKIYKKPEPITKTLRR